MFLYRHFYIDIYFIFISISIFISIFYIDMFYIGINLYRDIIFLYIYMEIHIFLEL